MVERLDPSRRFDPRLNGFPFRRSARHPPGATGYFPSVATNPAFPARVA